MDGFLDTFTCRHCGHEFQQHDCPTVCPGCKRSAPSVDIHVRPAEPSQESVFANFNGFMFSPVCAILKEDGYHTHCTSCGKNWLLSRWDPDPDVTGDSVVETGDEPM